VATSVFGPNRARRLVAFRIRFQESFCRADSFQSRQKVQAKSDELRPQEPHPFPQSASPGDVPHDERDMDFSCEKRVPSDNDGIRKRPRIKFAANARVALPPSRLRQAVRIPVV
jgi:hypothetical protein